MKGFKNRLVASCQDKTDWTTKMAVKGGAGALRVNGVYGVRRAREASEKIPVIACWKKDLEEYDIRITPTIDSAVSLAQAGADFVAFDATERERPCSVAQMVEAIHHAGALAVADVSSVSEACAAWECKADIVATTLFPFVDYGAIRKLAGDGLVVMAEGGIRTPMEAKRAVAVGADLVCVGSAISRPHHITQWFVEALDE